MAGYVIVLVIGIAIGLWLGRRRGESRAVRALGREDSLKRRKAIQKHGGLW